MSGAYQRLRGTRKLSPPKSTFPGVPLSRELRKRFVRVFPLRVVVGRPEIVEGTLEDGTLSVGV